MPAKSPPTNTRLPASAMARARPALSFSTSDGLVPQVGLGVEEKNWGAGPVAKETIGLTAAATGAAAGRAAMPTMLARADVGPPRLAAASPKANTLPDAATCQ